MSMGLAQRLREGTKALHSATERAGVMPALLRGTLPAASFHRLQRNLQWVYAALEPALQRHAAHPLLAPLPLPLLARGEALAADLQALHGAGWATALPLANAAQAYAARLHQLSWANPGALAAHAYVRYLGDLNGGQTLRRLVQRAYALAGDEGTRFFDFGPPERVAALALAFRQALDRLPADEDMVQALVAEARWSFEQHRRLFTELATDDLQPA